MESRHLFSVTTFLFLCAPLFLANSIFARPTVENEGRPTTGLANVIDKASSTEDVYERLKLGDAEAWRQYGSEVVDVVHKLVDEGAAKDPFDAVLILFYPNLTPQERKAASRNLEPLLPKLALQKAEPEVEDLTLYKRELPATFGNGQVDNAHNAAWNEDQTADDEQLRNALRQLKIEPSEALINLDISKRPPQRRGYAHGQKEMPIYLGTHESPEGVSWRV